MAVSLILVSYYLEHRYEDIDERAIEAAKWTDREIVRLIDVIKKNGAQNAKNGEYYDGGCF